MERLSGIFHLSFAHLTCKKQERTNSSSPQPALRFALVRSPSSARSHAAPSLLPPSLPRPAHSTGYLCKGLREANSRPPKTRCVHTVCFAFRNCQSQALALHFRRGAGEASLPSSFRHRNDCSSSEDGRAHEDDAIGMRAFSARGTRTPYRSRLYLPLAKSHCSPEVIECSVRDDGDGEGEDADLTSRISVTKEAETLRSLPFRASEGTRDLDLFLLIVLALALSPSFLLP